MVLLFQIQKINTCLPGFVHGGYQVEVANKMVTDFCTIFICNENA